MKFSKTIIKIYYLPSSNLRQRAKIFKLKHLCMFFCICSVSPCLFLLFLPHTMHKTKTFLIPNKHTYICVAHPDHFNVKHPFKLCGKILSWQLAMRNF